MTIHNVIMKLLLKEPFYGHIASKLVINSSSSIKKLQITPQLHLIYNKHWFQSLNDNIQYGTILHELLHLILRYPFRKNHRNKNLWAVACDIVVNQYIQPEYRDSDWLDIEIVAKEFGIKILYYQSAEFYYDLLSKQNVKIKSSSDSTEALIQLDKSGTFKSDIIPNQEVDNFTKKQLTNIVTQQMGNSDIDIKQLNEIYSDQLINWQDILKKFLSHKGRRNKRKSYKRVSRRFHNYPGNVYEKGAEVLIALDESGSMQDETIQVYIKELKKINNITGTKISVVRFDSDCSEPVLLKQYISEQNRQKRGKTDFHPIFRIADQLKIQSVVIFTDGKGSCPESVNQRVLWLLTKEGLNPSNFGESVYFTT